MGSSVVMSSKQKVYQGVLQKIRQYIDHQHLMPGDKLPSERELADTLQAGRSSVREALRAMELLGLIETRRGEGTFLSTYRPYETVELLSSFILKEARTRKDLFLAKKILEKEAAKLAFSRIDGQDLDKLEHLLHDSLMGPTDRHVAFFKYLFAKSENLLLARVWQLMEEFSHTINKLYYNKVFYIELVQLYSTKNYQLIEPLFDSFAIVDDQME
ncbi:FadR/GntR family transcriptional regulator [Oceanobacillus manasiensis]|uniref:FadR/GntR family transcriptional regulator n=1 Tax=Oceanobacillus manasiensis TaxID=586413 RepID=UPI001E3E6AAA|nr:GntR family transcriptional regulator [Oceanobacillus manasiensis]